MDTPDKNQNPNTTTTIEQVNDPSFELETWKSQVQIQQQKYYVLLGNRHWDSIPIHPVSIKDKDVEVKIQNQTEPIELLTVLERKIAFGLYGLPSHIPDEGEDDPKNTKNSIPPTSESTVNSSKTLTIDVGYTEEQMILVHKISKLIRQHGSNTEQKTAMKENKEKDKDKDETEYQQCIWFSCVFICGKLLHSSSSSSEAFTTPLFKFMKKESKNNDLFETHKEMFIDIDCRIYDGFSNWLLKNKLPPCHLCYPTNGRYSGSSGSVDISFSTSPSSAFSTRFVSFLDKASLVTSLGSATVGIATLATLPISAPVISVASIAGILCGGYAVCKAGTAILDRAVHQQPIGLDDPASRSLWLHLVGGTLGALHLKLVETMSNAAHAGHLITKAEELGFLLVHVGEITSSGLEIIKSAVELGQKYERDELTPLDIYHFMASCLFFGHDVVTFHTAGEIIKQVQSDLLEKEKECEGEVSLNSLSKVHQNMMGQRSDELRGRKEVHGNTEGVVKEINHIENTQQFYDNLKAIETCTATGVIEGSEVEVEDGEFLLVQ